MKRLHHITLEVSGKAFHDDSDEELRRVCRDMYRDWRPLIERADRLAVLLWVADGSEILEYGGSLDDTFEWNCHQGVANANPNIPASSDERIKRHVHHYPRLVRPDAAPRRYGWLKRLIEVIRECAAAAFPGKPVTVGATFDNGPEFAVSDFKFRKHREIAQGHSLYANSFVVCTAKLHADPMPYAGFPEGIPEGTGLGTFLGRQFRHFARDLGFDYLWLSNGMGFGIETWKVTGALFDRQRFYPEKAGEAAGALLDFWRDLRRELPDTPIETRGSNFSAGVEMATDGCPLPDIYEKYQISPPVNSPWAALNYNTGIELAAWMSHIAEAPSPRIPYRFYIHDPWFLNSPWPERYGREAWDIYLPLSVARMNATGGLDTPDSLALLSVDDSHGHMPEQVPLEVIPHLARAFDKAPDAPAPLLWVYPFREYDRAKSVNPAAVFNEEWYLAGAIQEGLPLNTVIGTEAFRTLAGTRPEAFAGVILIVPVHGVTKKNFAALSRVIDAGGSVMFYGPLGGALPDLKALLELADAAPLHGEIRVESTLKGDSCRVGDFGAAVQVTSPYHAGGLSEVSTAGNGFEILLRGVRGKESRVLAEWKQSPAGGGIAFVRSLLPTTAESESRGQLVDLEGAERAYPALRVMRTLLSRFGWTLRTRFHRPGQLPPRINLSRHENAFFFGIFAPDTMVELLLDTPLGAPVFDERECLLGAGGAVSYPPKTSHAECRALVRQRGESLVGCKIGRAGHAGYTARRYYSGLVDADIRFFPPPEAAGKLEVSDNTAAPDDLQGGTLLEPEWCDSPLGRHVLIRNFTGRLHFSW